MGSRNPQRGEPWPLPGAAETVGGAHIASGSDVKPSGARGVCALMERVAGAAATLPVEDMDEMPMWIIAPWALLGGCVLGPAEQPGDPDADSDADADADSDIPPHDTARPDVEHPSDTGVPADTGEPSTLCSNVAYGRWPEDGASDAYHAGQVRVLLATPEPSAQLSLSTSGQPVAGSSTVDGTMVRFVPDAFLLPSTTYTVRLDWSCAPVTWTFTTSSVGTPVTAPLEGRTWQLDIGAGHWVEPFGVGPLLGALIERDLLLGVEAWTGADLEMVAVAEEGGEQPVCWRTIASDADFSNDPYFVYTATVVEAQLGEEDLTLYDVVFSGSFAADGSAIEGGTIDATVDSRGLVPLLTGGPPDAVCQLVAALGVFCEPCPDGSGTFCLPARVEAIPGAEVPGLTLEPRDEVTIEADPTCGGEDGAWTCASLPSFPGLGWLSRR